MRWVVLGLASVIAISCLGYLEPVLAMAKPIRFPRGAPGPLIGAGLPLAAAVAAIVLIVRRRRQKP